MANTQRTGKQTLLLVVSIIEIVVSALLLILGIMAMVGATAMVVESGNMAGQDATQTAQVGGLASVGGVIIIVSSIFGILTGAFGVMGAKDASKTMPYIVCAAISLGLSVITLFTSGVTPSGIIALIPDAVLLWLGISIRKEGFGDFPRGDA
jgi:hypothetical protein